MANIYEYTDYRKFLSDWYTVMKAGNARFSQRCIGTGAGIDAGNFANVVKGKRNLSIPVALKLADFMKLTRKEKQLLKKIVAGILAGDTDMMYSGFTKREFGNPELQCFTTSASKEIDGLPSMKTLFPSWKLSTIGTYKYFHAIELPANRFAEVREALGKVLTESEKFAPYVKNAKMVPGTEIADGLSVYNNVYATWKNKQ